MARTDEWTNVDNELPTRVVFDTVGDTFIGEFIKSEPVEYDGDTFTAYHFRGTEGDQAGKRYSMSGGYSLTTALDQVRTGTMCRIELVEEKDTGKRSPMKIFRVDTKK